MIARTRGSLLARLARLEAEVAKLPKSPRLLPAKQACYFRFLCQEFARPGIMLPSARPLLRAFTDCCERFPEEADADLTDPAIAATLPDLHRELTSFLEKRLGTDGRRWDQSLAWTELALAGFAVTVGMRDRRPTAQQWCAGLSDMELVFEAKDCLFEAYVRVRSWRQWLDRYGSGLEAWPMVSLPAEEEETLLAELGADTSEKRAAIAEQARGRQWLAEGLPHLP